MATEEIRTDFDDDDNGTIDRVESSSYVGGRLIRTNFDDTANGFFNRAKLYFYVSVRSGRVFEVLGLPVPRHEFVDGVNP